MIDSVGFSRRFIPPDIKTLKRHVLMLGGSTTNNPKTKKLLFLLFGGKAQLFLEKYPFVIWPKKTYSIDSKRNLYVMGGFTPNSAPHLGSLFHIQSINHVVSDIDKTLSFNDLDSKNSVRKVPKKTEKTSIAFFKKCSPKTKFQLRTKDAGVLKLFKKFQRETDKIEFDKILKKKTSVDEKKSLNIQAAAYLSSQFFLKRFVVGFDGIEEASRAVWINHLAKKNGLPGFINFISIQVPSLKRGGLKMGKSDPGGSINIGPDNLKTILKKIKRVKDTRRAKILWFFQCLTLKKIPPVRIKILPQKKGYLVTVDVSKKQYPFIFSSHDEEDWVILLNYCRLFSNKRTTKTSLLGENEIPSFSSILKIAKILSKNAKLVYRGKSSISFKIDPLSKKHIETILSKNEYSYEDVYNFLYKKNNTGLKKYLVTSQSMW